MLYHYAEANESQPYIENKYVQFYELNYSTIFQPSISVVISIAKITGQERWAVIRLMGNSVDA